MGASERASVSPHLPPPFPSPRAGVPPAPGGTGRMAGGEACGADCQLAVFHFEGAVVGVVLAVAAALAVCMLCRINTPATFHKPKDA